ncbi:MAG: class I SAM-dependent methyltransferase [Alphaproteobacteria bacterium]
MNYPPLEEYLMARMKREGPLCVGDFMQDVLGHAEHGYYMRQDPLGKAGDFTTAPEISQMFGEMIGLWLADIWMQFGQPAPFILLECGPGRGTMMADILRATKAVKGFHEAAEIHLLETSPVLKARQKQILQGYSVHWHDDFQSVPDGAPLFMVANEFFDALPFRQYQYNEGGWQERCIDYQGEFCWQNIPVHINPAEGMNLPLPEEGKILEISSARQSFMKDIAKKIKNNGGAGLVIDYGYKSAGYGDTFQAVHKHKPVEALSHIGNADLTSHVNFIALKEEVLRQKLDIAGLTTQGEFLKNLGIQIYASKLQEKAGVQQSEDIQKALHRLTHFDEMGVLFKVMGFYYGASIEPAGF